MMIPTPTRQMAARQAEPINRHGPGQRPGDEHAARMRRGHGRGVRHRMGGAAPDAVQQPQPGYRSRNLPRQLGAALTRCGPSPLAATSPRWRAMGMQPCVGCQRDTWLIVMRVGLEKNSRADGHAVPAAVDSPAPARATRERRCARWLLRHRVQPVGPGGRRGARQAAAVVEGDVPDRRRLLLHPVLPARHRRAGRRGAVPAGDPADRGADAARACCRCTGGWPRRARTGRARWRCWRTCCRSGGARSSCWSCSASSPPRGSSRSRCPSADATVHLLENPLRPGLPARPRGAHHRRAAAGPRRGVPARLQRGGRRRHPAGRGVPRCSTRSIVVVGLVEVVHHAGALVGVDRRARPRAAAASATSSARPCSAFPLLVLGPVRLRDRRQHDAAGRRRRRRPPRQRLRSPDPQHPQAAHRRRADHERLPARHQLRHHRADPRRRSSSRAARPTAARWPTSRTSTSARRSAPSTTSAAS